MRLPPIKKNERNRSKISVAFTLSENRQIYTGVILFFLGTFLAVFFGFKTIIGLFEFFRVLALCVVISIAVQSIFFRSAFPLKKAEGLTLGLLGLSPFLCGLFFILNFYISTESSSDTYLVKKAYESSGSIYFAADGLPCKEYPELCVKYMAEKGDKFKSGDYVRVKINKGIGGFQVIKNVSVIRDSIR